MQEPTLLARAKLCSQIPRQCKRIRLACRGFGSKARRIKLVKCLIAPKIKWASYWRALPDQWIYRFGLDIERCVRGPTWGGRSPALAWILDLGHGVHPEYLCDFTALSAWISRLRKQALAVFAGKRAPPLPTPTLRFRSVLEKWHWTPDDFAHPIVIKTQFGEIDITRLSKGSLERHAIHAWTLCRLAADNRFAPDDPWKTVAGNILITASAKKATKQFDILTKAAALGNCPDHRMIPWRDRSNPAPCSCGFEAPTRRHWLWSCPDSPMPTPPYSRLPTSQAEEGLLIPCIKGPKKHDKVTDIVPPQLLEALEQANSGSTPTWTGGGTSLAWRC